MAGATKAKAKEPEKPQSDPPRELLVQAREMIAAINHQNDHTRDWVRRCDEFLNPGDLSEEFSAA